MTGEQKENTHIQYRPTVDTTDKDKPGIVHHQYLLTSEETLTWEKVNSQ